MHDLEQDFKTFIEESYGLNGVEVVKSIDRGLSAFNYIIRSSDSNYFLKSYNPKRPQEQLREIQKAELFFFNHNVPAIAPLFNTKGETLSEFQGKYFGPAYL